MEIARALGAVPQSKEGTEADSAVSTPRSGFNVAALFQRHKGTIGEISDKAAGVDTTEVSVKSFQDLLDLVRGAVWQAEARQPEVLWSAGDSSNIRGAFRLYSNGQDRLPISRLIETVEELGFNELSEAAEQRWWADVTQSVMGSKKRHTFSGKSQPDSGFLTIEEFIQIVTRGFHQKARQKRLQDFFREREVAQEVGFCFLEVEDLRELHGMLLRMDGSQEPWRKVVMLLDNCGIQDLSSDQVIAFKSAIRMEGATASWKSRGKEDAVDFDVFLRWMGVAFKHFGGLVLKGQMETTAEDLAGHGGFAVAMLREHFRENGQQPGLFQVVACRSSTSASRNTSVSRRQSIGGESAPDNDLPNPEGKQSKRSLSTETSRAKAKASSKSPLRTPGRSPGRSPAKSPGKSPERSRPVAEDSVGDLLASGRGKQSSRKTSRKGSQQGSAQGSRSASKKGSSEAAEVTGSSVDGGAAASSKEAASSGVLVLSGLPPSEAMLGRKMFRAISVDFGKDGDIEHHSADMEKGHAQSSIGGGGEAPSASDLEARLQGLIGKAGGAIPKKEGNASRKEKTGQDSDKLVSDALAKLQKLELRRDDDHEEYELQTPEEAEDHEPGAKSDHVAPSVPLRADVESFAMSECIGLEDTADNG